MHLIIPFLPLLCRLGFYWCSFARPSKCRPRRNSDNRVTARIGLAFFGGVVLVTRIRQLAVKRFN